MFNVLHLFRCFCFFFQAFPISHIISKLFPSGKEAGSSPILTLLYPHGTRIIGWWMAVYKIQHFPTSLEAKCSLPVRFRPIGCMQLFYGLLFYGSGHVSFGPLFLHCLLPAFWNGVTEGHTRIRHQSVHLEEPRSPGICNAEYRLALDHLLPISL